VALGTLGTVGALGVVSNTGLNDYPPGPFIVLSLFGIFTITWFIRQNFKPRCAGRRRQWNPEHVH